MKTIRIFLASSSELSEERIQLSALIDNLNYRFEPRGFRLQMVKWEYLDSSMNPIRKQDEYNAVLSKCDICMLLFWKSMGRYTREEFNCAYDGFRDGRKPYKIYVFFKETNTPNEEVREFKNVIESTYGHFYNTFATSEKLQLDFLLQLELYQNSFSSHISFELRDGVIELDGTEIVNIKSLPFCANNADYKETLEEIAEIQEIIIDAPNNLKLRSRLEKLVNRKYEMEKAMIETAKQICSLHQSSSSARLNKAMKLFNDGKCREANTILSYNDITKDLEFNIQHFHDGISLVSLSKDAIRINIEECRIKIQTLKVIGGKASLDEIDKIYANITALIFENLPISDYIDWVVENINFLLECKRYNRLGHLLDGLMRCIDVERLPLEINMSILNSYAYYLTDIGDYANAEKVFTNLLSKSEILTNEKQATLYDNLASVHLFMRKIAEAKVDIQKAIALYALSNNCVIDLISSTTDFGYLLSHIGEHQEALTVLNWSLERLRTITQDSPDVLLEYGRGYQHIGTVYSCMGKNDEAIKRYKKAYEYFDALYKINPYLAAPHIASCLSNLGETCQHLNLRPESESYLNKALDLYKELCEAEPNMYEADMALCLSNYASILECEGKYDSAISQYKESINLLKVLKDTSSTQLTLASTLNNLAYTMAKNNDLTGAQCAYRECISICNKYNDAVFSKIKAMATQNCAKL